MMSLAFRNTKVTDRQTDAGWMANSVLLRIASCGKNHNNVLNMYHVHKKEARCLLL